VREIFTAGISSGEERMATHLCSAQPAQAVAEWQAPPGYAAKTGLFGLEARGEPTCSQARTVFERGHICERATCI